MTPEQQRLRELELELELARAQEAEAALATPAPPPEIGGMEALGHGIRQGGVLGQAEELGGAVQAASQLSRRAADILLPKSIRQQLPQTATDADGNPIGALDVYRQGRDSNIQEEKQVRAAHPWTYLGGELAGGLVSPGGTASKTLKGGKALLSAVAKGAGLSGLAGLGYSDADLTKGEAGKAAKDAAWAALIGGPAGFIAHVVPGAIGRFASRKGADIDEGLARAGNEFAKAETNQARTTAGNAATAAYKQPENLARSGRLPSISPEKAAVVEQLAQELGDSAEKNLIPNAARKAETAKAFAEATRTEGQRAIDRSNHLVSGAERLRKTGDRVKRYGLPMLMTALGSGGAGAAAGHSFGTGGAVLGGLMGAGSGAVLGNQLRPMVRSMMSLAKDPVYSRPAMSFLESLAEAGQTVTTRAGGPVANEFGPQIQGMLRPAFAGGDEDSKRQALANALLGGHATRPGDVKMVDADGTEYSVPESEVAKQEKRGWRRAVGR